MRISDWSSDVCSSDLSTGPGTAAEPCRAPPDAFAAAVLEDAGTALLPCRCGDYPHAPAYSLLRTAQFDQDRENPSPGSRSEERRVGKEWGSTSSSRWSPDH